MAELRLLERIRLIEKEPHQRGKTGSSRVVDSIMLHLRRILNTRQGSVSTCLDYGIPDFTNLASSYSSASVAELAESIRKVVRKYEPRLRSVTVKFNPKSDEDLELSFRIDARLATDDGSNVPVTFSTVVDPAGRVDINE